MILVTGGTGLVGAHLLLQLAAGDIKVRALYRTKSTISKTMGLFSYYGKAAEFDTIEWVQGDVVDVPSLEQAYKGIDYVYHCAAFISFNPVDEDALRKVNIEGTANMVNCALAFGVKKFCHVSSVATLGDAINGQPITEDTDWNPETYHHDYALSKHGAEMEVWRAWQEGLDVVVVNPGLIFGHGFWNQGSGEVFRSVKKGLYFYTKGLCGIVAVEDVVKVMTQLMQGAVSGQRFTLVAENISYKDLFSTIAKGMGKNKPPIYATPLLTSFAWRADWLLAKLFGKKRAFTHAMATSSHKRERFDNSKAIEVLQFKFTGMHKYLTDLAGSL